VDAAERPPARLSPRATLTGFYLIDAALTWDWGTFGAALQHLALPAATLAFPGAGHAGAVHPGRSPGRHGGRNFALYERAMGLPRPLIVWKYVLRSALTSTVTQIGLPLRILLAGGGGDGGGVRTGRASAPTRSTPSCARTTTR